MDSQHTVTWFIEVSIFEYNMHGFALTLILKVVSPKYVFSVNVELPLNADPAVI